ncbi:MFS_1 domain-containing protein [Rhizoctonia solani AG-1 IA]|uniref:MFS_1 domain-containing protein n=1 Tax=Thanatephorus cucumeris (strain AG1-IA) TaxID=983506 RepID=L8WVV5_THACA|nr:MFS_1 domain-containing protein [Rhizoctonia solani AG-1 IA]
MDINIGETPAGRLKMELFNDIVPKYVRFTTTDRRIQYVRRTAENFRQLCTGEHRATKGPPSIGGFVTRRLGTLLIVSNQRVSEQMCTLFHLFEWKRPAFATLWYKVQDENFQMKHTGPGLLSMVVFGKVIDGILTLRKIENVATGPNNRPKLTVKITVRLSNSARSLCLIHACRCNKGPQIDGYVCHDEITVMLLAHELRDHPRFDGVSRQFPIAAPSLFGSVFQGCSLISGNRVSKSSHRFLHLAELPNISAHSFGIHSTMVGLGFLTGLVASQLALVAAQNPKYTIAQDFSGSKFFDGWSFTNGNDAKNYGNVAYLAKDVAMAQQLVYLNAAGNAIIKVDNTTVGSPQDPAYGRASVKMNTTEPFTKGSLVVMDALHFPYGVSRGFGCKSIYSNSLDLLSALSGQLIGARVAPRTNGRASVGTQNVNLAPVNQMSLHTSQGCTLASDTQVTGRIVSNDCYNNTNGNQGCIIQMPDNSFGESFARNGGGVYAVEWSSTGNGIRAWFFPRSSIPADLTSANPNPSTWGTPTAAWPESGCDTSKFFGPQTLIINISICGAYAGATSVFESTCPNQGSCLDLVRNPRNYDNAYFEIAYVRIYSEYAFSFNVLDNSSSVWNNSSGTSSTITSTSQSGSATKTQSGANATGTTGSTNGAIYHSAGFIPAALSLIAAVPGPAGILLNIPSMVKLRDCGNLEPGPCNTAFGCGSFIMRRFWVMSVQDMKLQPGTDVSPTPHRRVDAPETPVKTPSEVEKTAKAEPEIHVYPAIGDPTPARPIDVGIDNDDLFPEGGRGCCQMTTNPWRCWDGGVRQHDIGQINPLPLTDYVGVYFRSIIAITYLSGLQIRCWGYWAPPKARRHDTTPHTYSMGIISADTSQLIGAAFSSKLWHFFLTQGVLQGLATGLCFPFVLAYPSQWFKRRRGLATGIVAAGKGPAGAATRAIRGRAGWADKEVLKDPVFWSTALSMGLCIFGFFSPYFFMPVSFVTYAASRIPTLSAQYTVLPSSIMNFSSALGRSLVGLVADSIGPANAFICAITISALSQLLIWNFAYNYVTIMVFSVAFGATGGCFLSLMTPLAAQLFGTRNLAGLTGTFNFFMTPGNLAAAPIAGLILSASGGNWHAPISYSGGVQLAAISLMLYSRLRRQPALFAKF